MGLLQNIFSKGAGDLIEKVGNTVDKFVTTKEEKEKLKIEVQKLVQDHEINLLQLSQKEVESYLKDSQSARDANVKIQESDKASWLSKNVAYLIDIFITLLFGAITAILFLRLFKIAASDVDIVSLMALHGTVTAVFMTIVNFHRGTSRGSENKQKQLDKIYNK